MYLFIYNLKPRLGVRKYSKCMKTCDKASTSGYCTRELKRNSKVTSPGGRGTKHKLVRVCQPRSQALSSAEERAWERGLGCAASPPET